MAVILEKRKSALLCIFGFSLERGEIFNKNNFFHTTKNFKLSFSLVLFRFSLLCCVHTTKSTEEEDGRDDEEEHYCEKQRRH